MTRAWLALALYATMGSACSAQAEYPLNAVLDVAKEACRDLSGPEAIIRSAQDHDWVNIGEQDAPDGLPKIPDRRLFGRSVSGEDLTLVAARVDQPSGDSLVICHVYDLGEHRVVEYNDIAQWAGRGAADVRVREDGGIFTWRPGVGPGHSTFETIQFGSDSLPGETLSYTGLVILFDREE